MVGSDRECPLSGPSQELEEPYLYKGLVAGLWLGRDQRWISRRVDGCISLLGVYVLRGCEKDPFPQSCL